MNIIFIDIKKLFFSKINLVHKVKFNGDKNGVFICIMTVKSYQFQLTNILFLRTDYVKGIEYCKPYTGLGLTYIAISAWDTMGSES